MDTRGFPYESFPSGWFHVAWSDEIAGPAARPYRFFGEDLVAYRGESGEVALFDAYCPHLGAHLGWGGKVRGDDLVCPFHGWRFDSSGNNTEIPYADSPNRAKKLRSWTVREVNGAIMVWYDALGREPLWGPPLLPELENGEYFCSPELRKFYPKVRLSPQWMAENLVDPAHQKFVHGSHDLPDIVDFAAEGPLFLVFNQLELGKGKKSTWLTPDGARMASINAESWGVGVIIGKFPDQDGAIHYQTMTPIDHEHAQLATSVWMPLVATEQTPDGRRPTPRALKRFNFLTGQLEADIVIWEHMRYEPKAPLAGPEAKPYSAFRRWARQFYPEADGTDWNQELGGELVGALAAD